MGQLRFPLWEPFVLEPTGPHEGTNYRDAQQDGGANLLPRCSELIITSTLRVVQSQCNADGQQKPACPFECNVYTFAPLAGCDKSIPRRETTYHILRRCNYYSLDKVILIFHP